MQHNPIELIKRLTLHFGRSIERPFYIYLIPNIPNIVYAIGVEPTNRNHVNISVDTGDLQKTTDQMFDEIKNFIETNQLIQEIL